MIKIEMEAESFEQLVKNLCDMLDRCGALDVAEVQHKYKLTYSLLWKKMGEFDLEMGLLAADDLMKEKFNAFSLSELPLENWHEYYELLERLMDDKRHEEYAKDLAKEIAW